MSLQINVLKRILCCLAMCLLEVWSLESSENHNDDLEINRVMRQLEENKRILSADSPVLLVSPLKKGMYPKPYKSIPSSYSFEEPESIFKIPNQSTVEIIMDLRHLKNYTNYTNEYIYGKQWDIAISLLKSSTSEILTMPEIFTRNETSKCNSHQFSLYAYEDIYLSVYLRVLNASYTNHREVFLQTTSISVTTPYRAVLGENVTFQFVLFNNQVVNLPVAMPILATDGSYPSSILTYTPVNTQDTTELLTPINITAVPRIYSYQVNNDKFWGSLTQITVPYVPFISNCKNYGEYIFLHSIIENSKLCTLYDYLKTVVVEQFGFLQIPTSDTCNDVQFDCIMDEAYFTANGLPKFYELPSTTEAFYITADPRNIDEDIIKPKVQFLTTDLIPIIVQNTISSTELPKLVNLRLEYYQVTKTQKRIVKGLLSFSQLIEKDKLNQNDPFEYTFTLTLHSMNHAELAIAFALDKPIYVILSFIIGIFSIAMIFFYYVFFKLSNLLFRRIDNESGPFFIKNFFKELYEYFLPYYPICYGIILGFIPNFIILFLLSVLMVGGFWDTPFFSCTSLNTENICETSIFEDFGSSQIEQASRRGRLGLAMIVTGLYGQIRIAGQFIPSSAKQRETEQVQKISGSVNNRSFLGALIRLQDKVSFLESESYDGNIFYDKMWLRGLFWFMSTMILILMVIIIFLSFSAEYGLNIWMWTFLLKLSQIVLEECLKLYVENELLLSTISCVISISLSVSGLGATDFFDYLRNTFINLGISTFEKTNQVLIVDIVKDFISETTDSILSWISKTFNFDDVADEEEDEQQNQQQLEEEKILKAKNAKNNSNQDDYFNDMGSQDNGQREIGNSSIFLTDNYEESIGSIEFEPEGDLFSDGVDKDNAIQKYPKQNKKNNILTANKQNVKTPIGQPNNNQTNTQNINNFEGGTNDESDDEEEYEDDCIEMEFKSLIEQKIGKKSMYSSSSSQTQRQQTRGKSESEEDTEIEHHSKKLKIFGDFCNNTFNLMCTPGQVLVLWAFYYPNQMFVRWGITKKGLVFYYLFLVLNIPFQIFMDILFLKTVEELHHVHTKSYYQFIKEKFQNRKLVWMIDDEELDKGDEVVNFLEPDLKSIHRWAYSTQFFFCLSIFTGGKYTFQERNLEFKEDMVSQEVQNIFGYVFVCMLNLGSIAILEGIVICIVNMYNLFGDTTGILLCVVFWIPVCFLIDQICVKIFCHRIWSVKNDSQEEGNPCKSNENNINKEHEQQNSKKQGQDEEEDELNEDPELKKNRLQPPLLTDKDMTQGNNSPSGLVSKNISISNILSFWKVKTEEKKLPKQVHNLHNLSNILSSGLNINNNGNNNIKQPNDGNANLVNSAVGLNKTALFGEDYSRVLTTKRKQSKLGQEILQEIKGHNLNGTNATLIAPSAAMLITPNAERTIGMGVTIGGGGLLASKTIKDDGPVVIGINENEFYSRLAESSNSGDLEEIQELQKVFAENREIKLFAEQQIEEISNYDISVHNFILEHTQPKKQEIKEKMLDLFLYNFKKFKVPGDAVEEFHKFEKIDFTKAIQEKERKTKYQDIKQHFQENEYKDQKFLKLFLKVNKQWLRKSTKLFFEDLIRGESHNQLKSLRKLILKRFGQIYGDLKGEGPVQEIIVKNVTKKRQPLKSDVVQYQNSPLHMILKYWKRRSSILTTAQSLVGGYFLKGDSKVCEYCKSNWGITVQSRLSVEDLFCEFYKTECSKLQFQFNVNELFNHDVLKMQPINQYPLQQYQQPNSPQQVSNPLNVPSIASMLSPKVIKGSTFLAQHLETPKQNKYLPKQFDFTTLDQAYEDNNKDGDVESDNHGSSADSYSAQEEEYYDSNSKKQQDRKESVYNLEREMGTEELLKRAAILKQKIIGRWQEYFFSHAKVVSVCFNCNNEAHDLFNANILEQKRVQQEREILQKAQMKATMLMELQSSPGYYIGQGGYEEDDDFEDVQQAYSSVFKKGINQNNSSNSINNGNNLVLMNNNGNGGGVGVLGMNEEVNPIIEEDNNEDQSQGDERLSRFGEPEGNIIPTQRRPLSKIARENATGDDDYYEDHEYGLDNNQHVNKENNNNNKKIEFSSDQHTVRQRISVPVEGLQKHSVFGRKGISPFRGVEYNRGVGGQQDDEDDEDDNDDDYGQSQKMRKSIHSNKSHDSKTHPMLSEAGDQVDDELDIESLNKKLQETNNRSFRIIPKKNKQLKADKQAQNNLQFPVNAVPFFQDFNDQEEEEKHNEQLSNENDGDSSDSSESQSNEGEAAPKHRTFIQSLNGQNAQQGRQQSPVQSPVRSTQGLLNIPPVIHETEENVPSNRPLKKI